MLSEPATRDRLQLGEAIADLLAGAWREFPSCPSTPAATLERITPLLLKTGSAALGWRQLHKTNQPTAPAAAKLREAYRLHTLQAAFREAQIKRVIEHFRSVGVEALLVKGWAAARLYPEVGLRPYGDIDLCVRPEQESAAVRALAGLGEHMGKVDIHSRFRYLKDRTIDQLFDRSQPVRLGDIEVRILGSEDHLRLLCFHLLDHGAWQPLWLCDIGAAVESLPENFDWDYCVGEKELTLNWIACAVWLAHELLDVRLDHAPAKVRTRRFPRWVFNAVLQEWGSENHYMLEPPMGTSLHPNTFLKALRLRWPNPIQATTGMGGKFNELPRFPFQIGECIRRTAKFMARLAAARGL